MYFTNIQDEGKNDSDLSKGDYHLSNLKKTYHGKL